MTARFRLAVRVLQRFEAGGAREALIGDVLEEISRGRSRGWVWRQVLGLCACSAVGYARARSHMTVPLSALVVGTAVLCAFSKTSLGGVIVVWSAIYLMAGTTSLVGHVFSGRTLHTKHRVAPATLD